MAELERPSALAGAAPAHDAPGVRLCERAARTLLWLQLRRSAGMRAELETALGTTLADTPAQAGGEDPLALWLAPGNWLIVSPTMSAPLLIGLIEQAAAGRLCSAVDVSDAYAIVGLDGERAVDLLCRGCGLDFHARSFADGGSARTRFAEIQLLIHRRQTTAFDLYVDRSLARYLWDWLIDAARDLDE